MSDPKITDETHVWDAEKTSQAEQIFQNAKLEVLAREGSTYLIGRRDHYLVGTPPAHWRTQMLEAIARARDAFAAAANAAAGLNLALKKATVWLPISNELLEDSRLAGDWLTRWSAYHSGRMRYPDLTPAQRAVERKIRRRFTYNAKITRRNRR